MLELLKQKLIELIEQRTIVDYYLFRLSKDWLIGFIEAEGTFYGKDGKQVIFSISQHLSDFYLILAIQQYLGVGKIQPYFRKDGRLGVELVVNNREELIDKIIPLMSNQIRSTKKLIQFNTWIQTNFNLPTTSLNIEITEEWLTGFVDGDGSFFTKITKSKKHTIGYNVRAVFDIAQINTETTLLKRIGDTHFEGKITLSSSGSTNHLVITDLKVLQSLVKPFFVKTPLFTRKYIDFLLWQEVLKIMDRKDHLTSFGLMEVRALRDLQHLHRSEIHPTIIKHILTIRPDWKDRLDNILNSKD